MPGRGHLSGRLRTKHAQGAPHVHQLPPANICQRGALTAKALAFCKLAALMLTCCMLETQGQAELDDATSTCSNP